MGGHKGLRSGTGDGGEDGITFFVGVDGAVWLEIVENRRVGVN